MIDELMQIFGLQRVDPPEPEPEDNDWGGYMPDPEPQTPDPDYRSPFQIDTDAL